MFKIDNEKCTGCENCVDVCPCGAIHKDENDDKCVIEVDLCADCGACQAECPFEAIDETDDEE